MRLEVLFKSRNRDLSVVGVAEDIAVAQLRMEYHRDSATVRICPLHGLGHFRAQMFTCSCRKSTTLRAPHIEYGASVSKRDRLLYLVDTSRRL